MQTLFEAANHISQEIERTRQHLTNLEQALNGLKPLITIEAATTTLTYTVTASAQGVEDLNVVNAATPERKKRKSKAAAKKEVVQEAPVPAPAVEVAVKLPATGADLWAKCMGRRKVTITQIADAALKKLKLDDSARTVITGRTKTWVYAAAKKGQLVIAGERDGAKLYKLARVNTQTPVETAPAVEEVPAGQPAVVAEVNEAG